MLNGDADVELIRRIKKGEVNAFGELVEKHQSLVINFCYRMLGNREDAEDIAQDAFLRAFAAIRSFQPRAKFSTWLLTIARNLTLNLLRNRRKRGRSVSSTGRFEEERQTVTLIPTDDPGPGKVFLRKERAEWVHQALQELSDTHRGIILLRDFEGMTYEEIATTMGCRRGTVKSRLFRAREQLRERLLECDTAGGHGAIVPSKGDQL
jgi:RNA polymerase sigma-70 factor (ECF subfamily)